MKKLFSILICCFLLMDLLNAQLSDQSLTALGNLDPNSPIFVMSSQGMKIDGSQFKNDDWMNGRIRLKKINAFSEVVDVLLDLENHEIYYRFKDDSENIGQLRIDELDAVVMYPEMDTLMYEVHDLYKRAHEGPSGKKFYEILYAGENTLLHLENKYLRKEEYVENLGMVRRPNVYKSRHAYYLIKGRRLYEMRRNVKSFEKVYPEYASMIKQRVKEEKIKLSQEEGMAQLMQLIEEEKVNWKRKRKKS